MNNYRNLNRYRGMGASRALNSSMNSSMNSSTTQTTEPVVTATTEYGAAPPQPEEDRVDSDETYLTEDVVLNEETSMEDKENQEEGTDEMKKQFVEKNELLGMLEEFATEYLFTPELYAAIEELCKTVYINDAGLNNVDVLHTLKGMDVKSMDAMKILQGFIQTTVEATEEVLKGLSASWRASVALSPQAMFRAAAGSPNTFSGSGESSDNHEQQESHETPEAPKTSEGQPADKRTDEEPDGEYDWDEFLRSLDEDEENNNGATTETEAETGAEAATVEESLQKQIISYNNFRKVVAHDMSIIMRSNLLELQLEKLPRLHAFVKQTFNCTAREWNHKPATERVNGEILKKYADYLLDNFYIVTDAISLTEDGDTKVNLDCLVCATQKEMPTIFRRICEDNPAFSFGDAMEVLQNFVIYGFEPSFDKVALKKIYDKIEMFRKHEQRSIAENEANSQEAYNAWMQANGEGSEESGEGSDEETGRDAGEDQPPRRNEGEEEQSEGTGKKKKKKDLLAILVFVMIFISVIGVCVLIFKAVLSSLDEDESWNIEAPAIELQPTTEADEADGETPATADTEAATETEETTATEEESPAKNTGSGLDVAPAGNDEATTQADSEEEEEQPVAEEKGIVVNAMPYEAGSAFDLPANQFGAFKKIEDGYYTCTVKVTPNQAQLMLNAMKKNGESEHTLRYIVMPETGLILLQKISLDEVEAIVNGEGDGYVAHFDERDYAHDKVTDEGTYYTVCKRISLAEVAELVDSSSPTDSSVYYEGTMVMITDNYAASRYVIDRKALVGIYHIMKEIGATEVSSLFPFEKTEVEQGNVTLSNA